MGSPPSRPHAGRGALEDFSRKMRQRAVTYRRLRVYSYQSTQRTAREAGSKPPKTAPEGDGLEIPTSPFGGGGPQLLGKRPARRDPGIRHRPGGEGPGIPPSPFGGGGPQLISVFVRVVRKVPACPQTLICLLRRGFVPELHNGAASRPATSVVTAARLTSAQGFCSNEQP